MSIIQKDKNWWSSNEKNTFNDIIFIRTSGLHLTLQYIIILLIFQRFTVTSLVSDIDRCSS